MPPDLAACYCVLCRDLDELDLRTQRTVDVIEEHGWQAIGVPADEQGPGWAYTIGLWHSHRIPELAMFGLDIQPMQHIINDLGRKAADGLPLQADQEREDVATVPVVLKTVDYRWYKPFFGAAIGFYRKPPFPFLQVVWPDRDGAYPWQVGAEHLLDLQPQLDLHPDTHPTGVWTKLL